MRNVFILFLVICLGYVFAACSLIKSAVTATADIRRAIAGSLVAEERDRVLDETARFARSLREAEAREREREMEKRFFTLMTR